MSFTPTDDMAGKVQGSRRENWILSTAFVFVAVMIIAILFSASRPRPAPTPPPGRVQVERGSAVATFRADSFSVQVWAIPHGRGMMIEIMPSRKVKQPEKGKTGGQK